MAVFGHCVQLNAGNPKQEFEQVEVGVDVDVGGGVTVIFAVAVTHGGEGGEGHTCGVCRVDTKGTQTDVFCVCPGAAVAQHNNIKTQRT